VVAGEPALGCALHHVCSPFRLQRLGGTFAVLQLVVLLTVPLAWRILALPHYPHHAHHPRRHPNIDSPTSATICASPLVPYHHHLNHHHLPCTCTLQQRRCCGSSSRHCQAPGHVCTGVCPPCSRHCRTIKAARLACVFLQSVCPQRNLRYRLTTAARWPSMHLWPHSASHRHTRRLFHSPACLLKACHYLHAPPHSPHLPTPAAPGAGSHCPWQRRQRGCHSRLSEL
jgi:hypothetical protein